MKRALLACLLAAGCSSAPVPNLDSKDPYERYLGALEASHADDPAAMKRIEAQLKDPDPLARTGAIVALAHAQPKGSLVLVTAMLEDPDSMVRTEAVRGVIRYHDPSSVEALGRVLASPDSPLEPKRTAAHELRVYPDSPTLRAILLKAMADPSAGVAYNAYQSLVRVTRRSDLPRDPAAAEKALNKS